MTAVTLITRTLRMDTRTTLWKNESFKKKIQKLEYPLESPLQFC